jgi:hypothetical protein
LNVSLTALKLRLLDACDGESELIKKLDIEDVENGGSDPSEAFRVSTDTAKQK